jgi:hypothetical protein
MHSDINGHDKVLSILGGWPSFHNTDVREMWFHRRDEDEACSGPTEALDGRAETQSVIVLHDCTAGRPDALDDINDQTEAVIDAAEAKALLVAVLPILAVAAWLCNSYMTLRSGLPDNDMTGRVQRVGAH